MPYFGTLLVIATPDKTRVSMIIMREFSTCASFVIFLAMLSSKPFHLPYYPPNLCFLFAFLPYQSVFLLACFDTRGFEALWWIMRGMVRNGKKPTPEAFTKWATHCGKVQAARILQVHTYAYVHNTVDPHLSGPSLMQTP